MRKAIIAVFSLAAAFACAQENDLVQNVQKDQPPQISYNKWSVELNGGLSKPTDPFTDGYYTSELSFFHVDLGTRYMFNPKFGLKLDVGYDKFENGDKSKEFETDFYKLSLQGVANLGRVFDFESWTNTFGLLVHMGLGYSVMNNDNFKGDKAGLIDDSDEMASFIVGVTGQVRLSDRFALTGDITLINNYKQNNTFDGQTFVGNSRGFDGSLYNASLGITYYLGSADKHADWYTEENNSDYEERFEKIESMLMDSDKDGVANYLDMEPDSAPGAMVDTKGVTIDANKNGVPDAIEQYIKANCNCDNLSSAMTDGKILEQLVNSGIINVYFDYDSYKPYSSSIGGLDFIVQYMKANPNANIDVMGYADPVGGKEYNAVLSQKRADEVKQILVERGINSSRMSSKGFGIDDTVGHQLARRVIFRIK